MLRVLWREVRTCCRQLSAAFSNPLRSHSFKNAVDEGVHKAKAKQLHKDWDHEREATLKRQHPVLTILNGPEARKWRVRRLIHSQHLYDPELDGITYEDITVWKNKTRPFNSDPNDKRGDQLRRGQLVEGFDAKVGKRAGFVQRGFVLRDQRPGEGRTRNHMACNPMLLPDIILRLYMDKQPHITKHVKKRARKSGVPLPIDTINNTFLCDPAGGGSKAMVSFHWSGLVYQGAFVMGEFNGYKGERMESQGHVNAAGEVRSCEEWKERRTLIILTRRFTPRLVAVRVRAREVPVCWEIPLLFPHRRKEAHRQDQTDGSFKWTEA